MTTVQYMTRGINIGVMDAELHFQSQLMPYGEHILFQLKEVFLYYGHILERQHASMITNGRQGVTHANSITSIYSKK